MSKRHFSILLAVTLAAALLVTVLAPRKTGHDDAGDSSLLLPEVASRINDVSLVAISSGTGAVTLQRAGERWEVAELQGYPADWGKLRQLLAALAQARVVEQKTDNPAYYARLGVEDTAGEGATGVLLELGFDDSRSGLIVGKDAGARGGQYVRLAGSERSLLIDQELDVAREPIDWAEREVVDVATGEVAEVEIIHPGGDWILARKRSAADTDFVLESLPEGREVASAWSVNSLGNALSALRMDAVEPAGEAPENTVRFRLLTFAGLEYTVQAWQQGEDRWIRVQASAPVLADARDSTEAQPEDAATDVTSETAQSGASDAQQRADAFNQRVAGWQFRIPEYKHDGLTKHGDSLLKALPATDGTPVESE